MKAFLYQHQERDCGLWSALVAAHNADQADFLLREEWGASIEHPASIVEITGLDVHVRTLFGLPEAMPHQLESLKYWERRLEWLKNVEIPLSGDPGGHQNRRRRYQIDEAKKRIDQTRLPFTVGELMGLVAFPSIISASDAWEEDPGLCGTLYTPLHPFGPVYCRDSGLHLGSLCNRAALRGGRRSIDDAIMIVLKAVGDLCVDPTSPSAIAETLRGLCKMAYASDVDLAVALRDRLKQTIGDKK